MFKKLSTILTMEKAAYLVTVVLFGFAVFCKFNPITIMIYGYLVSKYSYILGQKNENQKSIDIYEPSLNWAKSEIERQSKVIDEANRQLTILKEKLCKYEKVS